ncbi:MAG: hypothetical protein LUH43_07305 [Clostridia bacterium]|nr:hypothetical protein [Clostridia bacterium]
MKKSRFLSFALALLLTVTSVAAVSCGEGGTGSDITLANDTTDATGTNDSGSSGDTEDEGTTRRLPTQTSTACFTSISTTT